MSGKNKSFVAVESGRLIERCKHLIGIIDAARSKEDMGRLERERQSDLAKMKFRSRWFWWIKRMQFVPRTFEKIDEDLRDNPYVYYPCEWHDFQRRLAANLLCMAEDNPGVPVNMTVTDYDWVFL